MYSKFLFEWLYVKHIVSPYFLNQHYIWNIHSTSLIINFRFQTCRTEFGYVLLCQLNQNHFPCFFCINTDSLAPVLVNSMKLDSKFQTWFKGQHFHSVRHAGFHPTWAHFERMLFAKCLTLNENFDKNVKSNKLFIHLDINWFLMVKTFDRITIWMLELWEPYFYRFRPTWSVFAAAIESCVQIPNSNIIQW